MSRVDPTIAPDGYIAVADEAFCSGCAFVESGCCPGDNGGPSCLSYSRDDRCDVIFVKGPEVSHG